MWKIFNWIFWPSTVITGYYLAIQITAFCVNGTGLTCGFDFSLNSIVVWWIFRIIGPIALLALPFNLAYFGYRFSEDAAGLIYVFVPLVFVMFLAILNTPTYITNPLIVLFPFVSYFVVYYYFKESYFYLKQKNDRTQD